VSATSWLLAHDFRERAGGFVVPVNIQSPDIGVQLFNHRRTAERYIHKRLID
jgi:hypothetical protein